MGSCEFKSEEPAPNVGISKANFQMHYVVGRGGYGKVWKVKNKREEKDYAMKEMSKALVMAKKSVTSINFELSLLKRLRHPYAFQDAENLYLVLELSGGGDLRYHLYKNKKFNEYETTNLVLALDYIHSLAIIHRDLKPENILFDKNGYIRLTDFGIARTWSPNNASDTSGTPGYMAPEVLNAQPHGFAVDYWALGVILYELMLGRRPYPGIIRKEYKERIMSTLVQISAEEIPDGWTEEARDIINNLLQRKEESRLGSKNLKNIKEHAWFKDIVWEDILYQRVSSPFKPPNIDDYFDEAYLQSFEMNPKLKDDIKNHSKSLRNPDVQKLFKDYYFDKSKYKNSSKAASTSGSRSSK